MTEQERKEKLEIDVLLAKLQDCRHMQGLCEWCGKELIGTKCHCTCCAVKDDEHVFYGG